MFIRVIMDNIYATYRKISRNKFYIKSKSILMCLMCPILVAGQMHAYACFGADYGLNEHT